MGDNVYEFDLIGEEEFCLIVDDLGFGCGFNGMDWGLDNRFYGLRWFVGEIVSLDVDFG